MKFKQFFQDDSNILSMSRLLMFAAYPPSTYILLVNAKSQYITELLGVYVGAFVLGYIGGKFAEKKAKPDEYNVD